MKKILFYFPHIVHLHSTEAEEHRTEAHPYDEFRRAVSLVNQHDNGCYVHQYGGYVSSFSSLKHYEMPGKIDYFQTLIPCFGGCGGVNPCMTGDDVVAGRILVHHVKECSLYAGAFLVDGIVERVGEMIHTIVNLCRVHHSRRLAIPLAQLILVF